MIHKDRIGRARFLHGMCFFGNMPKLSNLRRINNFRNLNRMRIYSSHPFTIAGPIDWRQVVHRQQEYDPQNLMIPYEVFNPGPFFFHPEGDICVTQKLLPGQESEIQEGDWYLKKNCDKMYPYAFGIEHNRFGGSWIGRRNRTC